MRPLHHQDNCESRRLDLHQYGPGYEAGAYLFEPRRHEQRALGFEPRPAGLEPAVLPLNYTPVKQSSTRAIDGLRSRPSRFTAWRATTTPRSP
jgi:hypothetical protein